QGRNRPEASRDRAPRVAAGTKRLDVATRVFEDRHVGVAEGVDRLLAIADDEDRRWKWTAGRQPGAFTPRLDEQGYQLPLGAAGVLKLVDQHVVIARFQPIAALRELLHLAEQFQRTEQQVGEVEYRVRIERAAILGLGDAVHAQNAA